MPELLIFGLLVLLVTLGAGLVRVVAGPSDTDRMMAAQLLGTTGVAALLVLAQLLGTPGLVDVALVLALLAAVTVIAFTRRAVGAADEDDRHA